MTLDKLYSISTRHQRSARIDSDLSSDFFPGLVYHGTAQAALETLIRQYSQAGQRAYTLTGPYGSGKSTIALLITGLLHHDESIRSAALDSINQESRLLLTDSIDIKTGWLQIRATGGVRSPVETFWAATVKALEEHPATKVLHKKYMGITPSNESELISNWENLFRESKSFVDGILLISDEMGKTLDYINKNKGDLHLFQDLAEILGRIDTEVIFLGLLHQSFSEYAKERGTKLQEEWGKIQGRYTDILYNVSTDETVSLIAQSIVKQSEIADETVYVDMTLDAISENNQSDDYKKNLRTRLYQCAPLHPATSLLLGPLSKRRFSQNERSTFGFLNSFEKNSFQLFLKSTTNSNERYSLSNLWDYLESNLEHAILSSPDGHAWAEASETISRIDVENSTLIILKSIALLNIFGRQANLYATNKMLLAILGTENKKELDAHLDLLLANSAIIYRKHQSAWVVFEGSDLDVLSLLNNKIGQLTDNDESNVIDYIDYSQQIIAKGHYHTTGVLRWAGKLIRNDFTHSEAKNIIESREGEFSNFILTINQKSISEIKKITVDFPSIAIANAFNANEVISYAKEVYALDLLRTDKEIGAALQHDKVAKREYDNRLSDALRLLNGVIEEAYINSTWIIRGEIKDVIPLSIMASDLADDIFFRSPKIHNELVNRNKLSGTAVSARRKLLDAMLDSEEEDSLGITGFPPEMSMYISCLKNTNLHYYNGKYWEFSTAHVDSRLSALFLETHDYLTSNSGEMINISTLEDRWVSAPYGLTKGIVPIILFAYLKSLKGKIAYYENDLSNDFSFIAEPDSDYIHKLQRNSKSLAIKFIILAKDDTKWVQTLASYVATLTTQPVNTNLLEVATPLVTTMYNLPNWVRNTNNLTEDKALNKQTLSIRDMLLQANDPHELLIKKLPNTLDPENKKTFEEKIDLLEECINILKTAHDKMLSSINDRVKYFFPESGESLISMCQIVEGKSGDLRLKAFARELGRSQASGSVATKWLESLISIVIGRGIQNWNEGNLLTAKQKISEYAQEFLSLVKFNFDNNENEIGIPTQTKTVSLLLEDDNGKLVNYKKEIRRSDNTSLHENLNFLSEHLSTLNEFERIDVLQQLLKKELENQG
ncbi:hypothetical protein [Oceanisphaera sp. W20_SRM_FM3]|uniref:hypothetical protein n=1 Tax=Oceanisphaera sp. W20_SRM_FM3 TaxID=3240267 RepID=UPI003F9E2EF5